jgi:ribosomal protein S18 acetylase RimI-like enzyme
MTVYDIRLARPSEIKGILAFQRAAITEIPDRFYPETMGYGRLFVPATLNAVGFYEKLGYRVEGTAEITLNGSRLNYCKMWKIVA